MLLDNGTHSHIVLGATSYYYTLEKEMHHQKGSQPFFAINLMAPSFHSSQGKVATSSSPPIFPAASSSSFSSGTLKERICPLNLHRFILHTHRGHKQTLTSQHFSQRDHPNNSKSSTFQTRGMNFSSLKPVAPSRLLSSGN